MELSRRSILRTPVILLALLNLTILGIRLWPWQNVMSLPGNGTTGVDPAITLLAYVGLGFWIGSARQAESRKALFSAALLGMVAGLFLVAQVVVAARGVAEDPAAGSGRMQLGLLVCGAAVLGIVGLRASKAGFTIGFSAVCAIWASMVACLMAVAAVLAETYVGPGQGQSSDPWKDYQGLAIGTPALQSLVHSLNTIAGFLLIGPILGAIVGALFAAFGKSRKPEEAGAKSSL
jgi:hypothetical protein